MTSSSAGIAERVATQAMNRREFLTYAWGAAIAVLTVQGLGASYFFLSPRFRAGEFGGKFAVGTTATLPTLEDAPQANSSGKFWLVNTATGPKAIYMVCTHLGCLYKWSAQEARFMCPCHGSQFTREGDYICGPAPRSLDQFAIEVVANQEIVATTTQGIDRIQPPNVTVPTAELLVNTGKRLVGQSRERSPAYGARCA